MSMCTRKKQSVTKLGGDSTLELESDIKLDCSAKGFRVTPLKSVSAFVFGLASSDLTSVPASWSTFSMSVALRI
jgi:hypothetical protein